MFFAIFFFFSSCVVNWAHWLVRIYSYFWNSDFFFFNVLKSHWIIWNHSRSGSLCLTLFYYILYQLHNVRQRERLWHINCVWRRKKCHDFFAECPSIYIVSIVMFITPHALYTVEWGGILIMNAEHVGRWTCDRGIRCISGFPRKSEFLITGTTFEPKVTV